MATFEDAIPVILAHEGGWVANPKDPGGETNYGISTLIIEREGITNEELGLPPGRDPGWLKAMTKDAAIGIYKRLFWDKFDYGRINDQTAATKVFDCAVNCGPSRAHVMAQRVAGVAQDGILGPQSIDAINKLDSKQFVAAFAYAMRNYYTELVERKPSLGVFLSNWLRRSTWGT